jgi:hypothetical protein
LRGFFISDPGCQSPIPPPNPGNTQAQSGTNRNGFPLARIIDLCRVCDSFYGPRESGDRSRDLPDTGWPAFWLVELWRVIGNPTDALNIQLSLWLRRGLRVEEWKAWAAEDDGEGVRFGFIRWLPSITAEVAAVLDLCVRRLDEFLAHGAGSMEQPFVPTPLQRKVLEVLNRRAYTKDGLAAEIGVDPSQLHRDGLKPLMVADFVKNQPGVGYYRPDSPPAGSVGAWPGSRRVAG